MQQEVHLLIRTTNVKLTEERLTKLDSVQILLLNDNSNLIVISSKSQVIETLVSWPEVRFFQLASAPNTESNVPNHNLSVNSVNWVHSAFPMLDGSGIHISIKENAFDTTDVDLYPRAYKSNLANNTISSHANAMATIIAGAGNSSALSKGVASKAQLFSSDFINTTPNPLNYFLDNEIRIQNHSYGLEINNEYDALAEAYDLQTNEYQNLLHVFSSGNLGLSTPTNGNYANLEMVSNLSGGLKMAKNIILVGATNELGVLNPKSSRGPAYDGRVKPEITAYGATGTSDAAALVTGTAALLSEYFEIKNGQPPSSAFLKALLIGSANPLGNHKVNHDSGYGALNAKGALEIIENDRWFSGLIEDNQSTNFNITLPEGLVEARFVLVWNDISAHAGDAKALVNDLNLTIIKSSNSEKWHPWILDSSPDINSLRKAPVRGIDHLNNVELVTIENPSAGDYIIQVDASPLINSSQKFHVAYLLKEKNHFEWTFPSLQDILVNKEENIIRFENSFTQNGQLSIRYGNGEWQILDNILSLEKSKVLVLDTVTTAQLKATFDQTEFISDAFTISPKVEIKKEYSCANQVLFTWPTVQNASLYELFKVNSSGVLEPFMITSDTFAVIDISNTELNFSSLSMKPKIDGMYGEQVNLYNFSNDGIGCFLKSFNASVTEGKVNLSLSLSTLYNVSSVTFQKWNGASFETFYTVENINDKDALEAIDINPRSGYYTYRAAINLETSINGIITSMTEPIELAVVLPETITVFPNPLPVNEDLNILSEASSLRGFVIRNISGAKVKVDYISSGADSFTIRGLTAGFYLYQIFDFEGRIVKTGKLVVK
tara:strand:+ start:1104 stop:3605 length:2502 start_codon:yes stop_codon:yes gene_type:complete